MSKIMDIKSVSSSTALYTFVGFFLFKYLSYLGVLTGMYSFEHIRTLNKEWYDIKRLEIIFLIFFWLLN